MVHSAVKATGITGRRHNKSSSLCSGCPRFILPLGLSLAPYFYLLQWTQGLLPVLNSEMMAITKSGLPAWHLFSFWGRRLTLLQKLGDSLNDLRLRAGFSESCCARESFGSNCTPHILQMGKLRPRREGLSSEPSDPQRLVPTLLTCGSPWCRRLRGSRQSNGVGHPGWTGPAGRHKTLWLLDHGRPRGSGGEAWRHSRGGGFGK